MVLSAGAGRTLYARGRTLPCLPGTRRDQRALAKVT